MKVLHLVKTACGAAWGWRQAAVLHAAGVAVTVALPGGTRAPAAAAWRRAGAHVVDADLDWTPRAPWRLAAAMRRCRTLVDDVQPDLIHSHFVSTTLAARLALGRAHPTPRIFQVPGPLHLEHAPFRRLDLGTAGPSDVWIASCRWTEAAYRRFGVDAARVFLSYYGTDVERFAVGRAGSARAALGILPTASLVGMVAYMYRPRWWLGQRRGIKGHEDLIDAMRIVVARRPGTSAVIAGAAWNGAHDYETRLRARAYEACGGAIRFVGARDDVAAIYRDLDVAVHPSLSENCGGAVESQAAACPTVATSVGGLPDVVQDGTTGWLVPPRDPERLADAIVDALANPDEARRRARAGQAQVMELFDVERTGREVVAIYRRLLDRGTPARPALDDGIPVGRLLGGAAPAFRRAG